MKDGGKEGSTRGAWDDGGRHMGRGDYSHSREKSPDASLPSEIHRKALT